MPGASHRETSNSFISRAIISPTSRTRSIFRSGLTAYPPEWRCSTDSTWFPADLSALRKSRFQTHPENRRRRWIRLHAPDKSGGAGVRPGRPQDNAGDVPGIFLGGRGGLGSRAGNRLSGGSEGAFSLLVFGRIPGGQRDQLVNRQGVHQILRLRRGIGRAERSKRQFLSGSDAWMHMSGRFFSLARPSHACSRRQIVQHRERAPLRIPAADKIVLHRIMAVV